MFVSEDIFRQPIVQVFLCINRMNRFEKKTLKHKCHAILTWIGEFRPGNKTIWVVFDEESDVLGPRTLKLSLDQVF